MIFLVRNLIRVATKMQVFAIENCTMCDSTHCHMDFCCIYDWGHEIIKVNKVLYEQSILISATKFWKVQWVVRN
jgi:hypothetical protein